MGAVADPRPKQIYSVSLRLSRQTLSLDARRARLFAPECAKTSLTVKAKASESICAGDVVSACCDPIKITLYILYRSAMLYLFWFIEPQNYQHTQD